MEKNLGHATAYGYAKSKGYSGTEDEFAELMADYASVGQSAAQSAEQAQASATSAGQSAIDASASATTAETAKTTAQAAASSAQTYASASEQSAQSAQASAQSAQGYAQTAESAKDTAVNAVDGFAAGAQQALDGVNQAGNNWKSLAQAKALDSEAYALGTRDGEDVGSSDPAYHNNAKYYAEQGGASAQTATEAAQTATQKAGEAAQSASAFDTEYLDYSMVNRVIPSECVSGKFLNGVSGAISDNASYFVTGYMPIREGETLYSYRTYTIEPTHMRTVAVYDENKNLISSYGVNAATQSITYRDGMAYIRACILLRNGTGGLWQTPETVMLVAHPSPISTPTYESKPKIKGEYTRKKIYVYSTDDEATAIQKMVNAYNLTDCDVVFERSTYMFGDVLPTVMTLYGLSRNEIPVGNNCRYYFNGATLRAEIDLETLGSDFNCNLLGTQYKPTNFEMYDGILIATDTRYVMHDEAATLKGSYKHLYQNMIMEYQTNISTDPYRKCIGGGTGASGVIEIVGCKFTTDSTEVDVSYHGNAYDVVGAEFMVNVRNCWFSNSFRAGELSTNQTGKLIFANNSTRSALQTFPRWDATSFLNEVRT